ncbi:MAG: hypothetical protein FJY55_16370 [Betaproteobacteria bacterium]|nr:hypothetical protein [Betaproteobacteria bacterium]
MPATVVITQPFQALAKRTCANLGVTEFAAMVVEHPLFTRNDAWLEKTAAGLVDRLVATLFSNRARA